ncbi:hypothetical protein IKQ38_04690 [Candidatus Saccharibacteria bacterium]|nr:hypothetical protein [Candidatus Saccharibacteria bacterium]
MLARDGLTFKRMILIVEDDVQNAKFVFLSAVVLHFLAISNQVVEQKAKFVGGNTAVGFFIPHFVQTLLVNARNDQMALRKISIRVEDLREVQSCIQVDNIMYVGLE